MTDSNAVYVDPVKDLGPLLLDVEKPARYCGGEHGCLAKKDPPMQTLIAFPDLYEIGMSNQAFRIIYNNLNSISGISCDRAFAPAPDFEELLRSRGLPLYGLDTGISLHSTDLLLFTLGYELGFSGILAMLDVSGIPLRSNMRGENDPVVFAGGPAVSNPMPYCEFIDAFWIGEAEAGFFTLVQELSEIKKNAAGKAAGRNVMLERIREHPSIWMKGKEKAIRAVDSGFATRESPPAVFPVASMKTVQHHGILEIMRGCPNGCRFCHAGFWYRPMRQKKRKTLVREAGDFITHGGYREISLSSLSSGDYEGIGELVDELNNRFSAGYVSFQLPSLRVSTFNLSLLEKISQTRKSGLTFAVETPLDIWQLAINKRVTEDSVAEILREAKKNGWRGAKFYFMIGLPVPPPLNINVISEEDEIVNFINNVARKTSMHFNINVGIFVPKPHTPYQRVRQLDRETSASKLEYIRSKLKPRGHKVSISDPLVSVIEGILSRGDQRAGDMVEEAFLAGSRLDPWQEFIDRDAWLEILKKNAELVDEFLCANQLPASAAAVAEVPLLWQFVVSGVSSAYLQREFEKSGKGEMTASCEEHCTERCGVCTPAVGIMRNQHITETPCKSVSSSVPSVREKKDKAGDPAVWRVLFSFTKEGGAVFHGHLSLIEIFSMALTRAGLDVIYTQGFNPLAKLEIVAPLSVGINAGAEIAAADFSSQLDTGEFIAKMNATLPEGIRIGRAKCYLIPPGGKKHSLSSLLWGFGYTVLNDTADLADNTNPDGETVYIPASEEKVFRQKNLTAGKTFFSLRRVCVLAKNITANKEAGGNTGEIRERSWASYFDVYRYLYTAEY